MKDKIYFLLLLLNAYLDGKIFCILLVLTSVSIMIEAAQFKTSPDSGELVEPGTQERYADRK
jgi:hypothetical protein